MNRQMLRRNKELEDCIKFQRETLQDQAMRIEVNRMKILEGWFHFPFKKSELLTRQKKTSSVFWREKLKVDNLDCT